MHMLQHWLIVAVAAFAAGSGAARAATDAVDDARLSAAHDDRANWLTYGHGYANEARA